jgi:hypothetical protein
MLAQEGTGNSPEACLPTEPGLLDRQNFGSLSRSVQLRRAVGSCLDTAPPVRLGYLHERLLSRRSNVPTRESLMSQFSGALGQLSRRGPLIGRDWVSRGHAAATSRPVSDWWSV